MTVGRRVVKGEKRQACLALVAVGLLLGCLLGLRAPRADAAAGDAEAVGLDVQLAADLSGAAVLRSSATAGSVAAPPGADQQLVDVDATGVGVQGGAAAVATSASSTPLGSRA